MTVDEAILSALRSATVGVSGAELSQKLGISRAAIWARIEALRELGYEIEASPHLGYRLLESPDRLLADDIKARLGKTRIVGREIQVYSETTSTNDVVERLALDGVAEGIVVFAETQTKGRGRLGRKWISPQGKGLWFSVLLRPSLRPTAVTQLTLASATALFRAVQKETGLVTEIKWPNDILLRGKKVAGVLTELSAEVDRVHFVVLGIGIDVNVSAAELPKEIESLATSLRIGCGQLIDRSSLAAAVLRELDHDYHKIAEGRFQELAEEWEDHCTTLGRRVAIRIGSRTVEGTAESIDAEGALLVRTQHGHLERIMGGDVSIQK